MGKQILRGHKQNLVCPRTQGGRSSDLTRDRPRPGPLRVLESLVEVWIGGGLPSSGSGELSVAVRALDLLKEVAVIFITSTIVWSQVKQWGGNTAPPTNRKLD